MKLESLKPTGNFLSDIANARALRPQTSSEKNLKLAEKVLPANDEKSALQVIANGTLFEEIQNIKLFAHANKINISKNNDLIFLLGMFVNKTDTNKAFISDITRTYINLIEYVRAQSTLFQNVPAAEKIVVSPEPPLLAEKELDLPAIREVPQNYSVTTTEKVVKPLKGLQYLVDNKFTEDDIPDKTHVMQKVFPWVIAGLMEYGYDSSEVSDFLAKYFDGIDYKQAPNLLASEVNQALEMLLYDVESNKKATAHDHNVQKIDSQEESSLKKYSEEPKILDNSSGNNILEEKKVLLNDEPAVPMQPLILSGRDRVQKNPEPIMPIELIQNLILNNSHENETVVDSFQKKFENITRQPFSSDSYDQFYAEIHAALRERYDEVLINAQSNLTRYSNFYTPTPTEKVALQFLSTLKSQYVRLQAVNSSLGVTKVKIINSLDKTDVPIDEEALKTFIQDYLNGTKNIFTNIDRLEEMITIAKSEEKPALGEAYRAQFESLRVEGAKVLTTLPTSHHLYSEFKTVVEKGIGDLIYASSVEHGGDKAVLERSSYFISLRDRIKASIAYVKAEQEFENFKNRQLQHVQKIELSLSSNTENLSPEKNDIKKMALQNLATIHDSLTKAGSLPSGVSMLSLSELTLFESTKDFASQKDFVKVMLGETAEILKEIQSSNENENEVNELNTRDESTQVYPTQVERARAPLQERRLLLRNQIPESTVSTARLGYLRSLIKPARMGALALLAVAFGSLEYKPAQKEVGVSALNNFLGMSASIMPNQITFDRSAIEEFLKVTKSNTVEAKVFDAQPVIATIAPKQSVPPIEVVSGVVLPVTNYASATLGTAPELKIYGSADSVPLDPNISFNTTNQSEQGAMYTEKDFHTVAYGDTFWDISEGESLAGSLPVMKQINPYFKQHLIDRLRDALNNDASLREKVGGFGSSADKLITGAEVNIKVLNEEAVLLAINYGYLQ